MDRGRVVRNGSPEEVWRDPGTVAVAELLGHTVVRGPFAGITPGPGQALAVRPDAVKIDPHGSLKAVVVSSAFRGPDWVVTVDIGRVRVGVMSAAAPRPGEKLQVTLERAAIVEVDA
jgi:ABC-type Fe3+/spermidine/putrescine transport system ATPase subunit